jgi:hypothetical protein
VRKAQPRCARTKNGDEQIVHLHHCFLHYRVIEDAHIGTSPIRIHLRLTLVSAHLQLEINLRCAQARVTDLIADSGHYATNRRRAKGRTSPITKKFEIRFN